MAARRVLRASPKRSPYIKKARLLPSNDATRASTRSTRGARLAAQSPTQSGAPRRLGVHGRGARRAPLWCLTKGTRGGEAEADRGVVALRCTVNLKAGEELNVVGAGLLCCYSPVNNEATTGRIGLDLESGTATTQSAYTYELPNTRDESPRRRSRRSRSA